MARRFLRFNLVGALGIGVRIGVLAGLAGALEMHYLVATAIAIEVSVLHNFFWHERWTWSSEMSRGGPSQVFFRCLAFHAGNGLVSMLGSLALMPLLVGRLGLHYLVANVAALTGTGLVNFLVGDRLIFRRG